MHSSSFCCLQENREVLSVGPAGSRKIDSWSGLRDCLAQLWMKSEVKHTKASAATEGKQENWFLSPVTVLTAQGDNSITSLSNCGRFCIHYIWYNANWYSYKHSLKTTKCNLRTPVLNGKLVKLGLPIVCSMLSPGFILSTEALYSCFDGFWLPLPGYHNVIFYRTSESMTSETCVWISIASA